MKVLILGYDGYIGYPLTLHLLQKGHTVWGVDNFSRRLRVNQVGSDSLTPIIPAAAKTQYLRKKYGEFNGVDIHLGVDGPELLRSLLFCSPPDVIFHLAEQPSAPFSMRGPITASETQLENVIGTLHLLWAIKEEAPHAHLIKIGTMGEYGTPNCDIPEGRITSGPMEGLLFPRTAGSWYHLSKVHDTHNIEFACRNWGLRSTDIMQGIVFGLMGENEEMTRFDYDEYFGTVINRFCVQSIIGHFLTIYGKGNQTRGFLPLKDSIQCLTIAMENPPTEGEYRTFNQFESIHTINELAEMVCSAATILGIPSVVPKHINNPRREAENHYYNPTHSKLFNLGYKPTIDIQDEITELVRKLLPYKDMVKKEVILPKTHWK